MTPNHRQYIALNTLVGMYIGRVGAKLILESMADSIILDAMSNDRLVARKILMVYTLARLRLSHIALGGIAGCWIGLLSYRYYQKRKEQSFWEILCGLFRPSADTRFLVNFTACLLGIAVVEPSSKIFACYKDIDLDKFPLLNCVINASGCIAGYTLSLLYNKSRPSADAPPSDGAIAAAAEVAAPISTVDLSAITEEIRRLQHENAAMITEIKASLARERALRRVAVILSDASNRSHSLEASDDTPGEFICPITQEIMREPVIANDRMRYERAALQRWYDFGNSYCPIDRSKSLFRPDSLPLDEALLARIVNYLNERISPTNHSLAVH